MAGAPCGDKRELVVTKPVVYKCGTRRGSTKPRCPSGSRKMMNALGNHVCVDVKSLPVPKKDTRKKGLTKKKGVTKKKPAVKKPASGSPLASTPLAVLISRLRGKKKKQTARKNTKPKNVAAKKLTGKRPRCPRGTRRSKTTGNCEPALRDRADLRGAVPIAVVPDSTPTAEREISRAVATLVSEGKTGSQAVPVPVKTLVPKIKKTLVAARSFSPAANARLAPLESAAPYSARSCDQSAWEYMKQRGPGAPVGRLQNVVPEVQIGTDNAGGALCKPSTHPAAQAYLLRALKSRKSINCKNVIAPLQVASNCWFNTMFMVFFVGDKGRKFFQGFREMMIRGVRADGRQVEPKRLRDAFSTLNVCIEAALNRSGDDSSVTAALDTNHIIGRVYNGIPRVDRAKLSGLRPRDKAGNPLDYYDDIISYLGQDDLLIQRVGYEGVAGGMEALAGKISRGRSLPDVVVVELFDELAVWAAERKLIGLGFGGKTGPAYELASAIVRDTDKRHFCALLSCGGREVGYDGASFSRMSRFKWKSKINTRSKWTFAGSTFSDSGHDIRWSFSGCYQLLFYFRVR